MIEIKGFGMIRDYEELAADLHRLLPYKQAMVFMYRHLGYTCPTYREIGAVIGVCSARASQLHHNAARKLAKLAVGQRRTWSVRPHHPRGAWRGGRKSIEDRDTYTKTPATTLEQRLSLGERFMCALYFEAEWTSKEIAEIYRGRISHQRVLTLIRRAIEKLRIVGDDEVGELNRHRAGRGGTE